MKKIIFIALCSCIAIGRAQDNGTRFGVGVSIDPPRLFLAGSNMYSNVLTPVNIYFPITARTVRVEPDFGLYSYTNANSGGGSSEENDVSMYHVGAGLLYMIPSDNAVRLYVGPRGGVTFVSTKSSSTNPYGRNSSESSEMDFVLGACVGGEYQFAAQFSVGGEAQLNYISLGTPDVTSSPASPSSTGDVSRHLVASNVLFFFRWYY